MHIYAYFSCLDDDELGYISHSYFLSLQGLNKGYYIYIICSRGKILRFLTVRACNHHEIARILSLHVRGINR